MEQTADKEIEKIIKFLFNDLNEEEAIEIGEKIFSVEGFAERIEALKSKLIDSYILEQMSKPLKKEFEEKFLNTLDGRREVEETRILREELHKLRTAESNVDEPVKTSAGWFGLSKSASFAALLILLCAGFAGAVILYYQLKSDEIAKIIDSNTITPIPMPSETQTIKVSNDNRNQNNFVTPNKMQINSQTPRISPEVTPKQTFPKIFAIVLGAGPGKGGGGIDDFTIPKDIKQPIKLKIADSITLDSQIVIIFNDKKLPKIYQPTPTREGRIIELIVAENLIKMGENNIQIQLLNQPDISSGDFKFRRR